MTSSRSKAKFWEKMLPDLPKSCFSWNTLHSQPVFPSAKKKRGEEVLLTKQDMGVKLSRSRKSTNRAAPPWQSPAVLPGLQTLRHLGPQDVSCAGCPLGCCSSVYSAASDFIFLVSGHHKLTKKLGIQMPTPPS